MNFSLIVYILKADDVFSRELRTSDKENCSDLNEGNIDKIDFDHLQALVLLCDRNEGNDSSTDVKKWQQMLLKCK